MGLFSSKKNLCPICGNPTPRIFPTKIEDEAICGDCASKVYLPDGMLNGMSLDAFRQYMSFYEQNGVLRSQFAQNYQYSFGFLSGSLQMDTVHRLFRVRNADDALVIEGAAIKEFRILEDSKPLFVGTPEALQCYDSDVPERAHNLAPMISQFMMHKREYERREQMEKIFDDDKQTSNYNLRPTFDVEVFQHFYIEIYVEHPYWQSLRWEVDAPDFNRDYPSVETYLNDYRVKVEEMHTLALNIMLLLNPNAGEVRMSSMNFGGFAAPTMQTAAASAPAGDAVAEIKKYKELLDAGIITEEEFSAKKRQLLGI